MADHRRFAEIPAYPQVNAPSAAVDTNLRRHSDAIAASHTQDSRRLREVAQPPMVAGNG
jgi:hypothetical protein